MYLATTPKIKQKSCNHNFITKYVHGSCNQYYVCTKCNYRKKIETRLKNHTTTINKNPTLTPFLDPAFKQSNISIGYSEEFYWKYQFNTNWNTVEHNGWRLPSTGEPHDWCGQFQSRGCLDTKAHKQNGFGNKVFVKQFPRSCFRPICKICYKKWNGRQSNRATKRIEEYVNRNQGQKPIHVFFSPPRSIHYLSYDELKQEFRAILKKSGIIGGAVIFHPFRFDKIKRQWYWSPHFHLVGFGSIRKIQDTFGWKGWYVGNKGVRKSVFHTFYYLMSHSGIRKKFHTLTWIGDLSYCKLPVDKEPSSMKCPACGGKLIEIYQENVHSGIPPDEIFEGFVDSEGWCVVNTNEYSEPTYEYASTRDLNELLKGLALVN